MKKFTLFFLALFLSCFSYAEEKIGSYHSTYYDSDFEISADQTGAGKISVYISIMGVTKWEKAMFSLDLSEVPAFRAALELAKFKFTEWKKVAEDNGVTEMKKDMPIPFPKVNICWYTTKWWFSFDQKLQPSFIVTGKGVSAFAIMGSAQSSESERISLNYYFALGDETDFNALIEALDEELIKSKFTGKQDVQALFK